MDINSPDSNLASEPQLRFGKIDGLISRVSAAISAARKLLFSAQHEEGYWCGELEADARRVMAVLPKRFARFRLTIHPENPDVRTDMGTAYFYNGNADRAITELQTSLKYRPGHPQTLFNLGWVKWQGKQDPKGASEAWQQLLKENPNYPQRQQVEQYIAKAKEHATRG